MLRSISTRVRSGMGAEAGLMAALLIFLVIVGIDNPVFLRVANLFNILRSAAYVFIVAQAGTFVLVGGGLDLSVGSVFAAGSLTSAELLVLGAPAGVAVLGGAAVGAAIGLINVFVIEWFRIPALIVTLGMLYIARGAAEVATNSVLVPVTNMTFSNIGGMSIGVVPIVVIYAVGIGCLAHIVLEHSRFGYHVRAVGGNPSAARAVGIRVRYIRVWVYVLSGASAALSGTLTAGWLQAGDPNIAVGYELTVISAVIIGGTSLFGGVGTILGTALGAILLNAMTNGLVVVNLNPLLQNVAVGIVIIAAVGLDQWKRRRAARRGTSIALEAELTAPADQSPGKHIADGPTARNRPLENGDVRVSISPAEFEREEGGL